MTGDRRPHRGHLYREPGADRAHLSLNDWYGYGVLRGLGGDRFGETRDNWHHWYCGKAVAIDQYRRGYIDGQRLRLKGEL